MTPAIALVASVADQDSRGREFLGIPPMSPIRVHSSGFPLAPFYPVDSRDSTPCTDVESIEHYHSADEARLFKVLGITGCNVTMLCPGIGVPQCNHCWSVEHRSCVDSVDCLVPRAEFEYSWQRCAQFDFLHVGDDLCCGGKERKHRPFPACRRDMEWGHLVDPESGPCGRRSTQLHLLCFRDVVHGGWRQLRELLSERPG